MHFCFHARHMYSRRTLLLILTLLAGCAKEAPSEPPELLIRKALAEQEDAWNRHDAKAWVAAFTEDAEFINILGTSLQGRAEIERRHDEIFRTIFARSRVAVQTRKVRALGSGAALAETDYQLRDYDRLPPGIRPTDADGTLRTRLKYVWERRPEGWRIVSAQNTAILPLPSSAPSPALPSSAALPSSSAPPSSALSPALPSSAARSPALPSPGAVSSAAPPSAAPPSAAPPLAAPPLAAPPLVAPPSAAPSATPPR